MKKRTPSKAPGQRQLRVGEELRHALSSILREAKFRDPDLSSPELITVTAVELGPDLKHAHCFIMPLGGKDADKAAAALNRAAGFLRSELARRIDLRYTPKLSFRIDKSFDESDRIERLLEKTRTDGA